MEILYCYKIAGLVQKVYFGGHDNHWMLLYFHSTQLNFFFPGRGPMELSLFNTYRFVLQSNLQQLTKC